VNRADARFFELDECLFDPRRSSFDAVARARSSSDRRRSFNSPAAFSVNVNTAIAGTRATP
jgi:hypothetical protein